MKVLQQQHWHFLLLMILLSAIAFIVKKDLDLLAGEFGGIRTNYCLVVAILAPIVHQLYVLVCWRLELHYKRISKAFGANAFRLYKIGFAILILSRLVTIIMLALSNRSTLSVDLSLIHI